MDIYFGLKGLREIMGPVGIIRKDKTKNALLQKIISMLVQIGGKILAPLCTFILCTSQSF